MHPDESYAYDNNGNRLSSQRHGSGYVTGANNELLSDGVYGYAYDDEGNLIRQTELATGKVRELSWDYRNRLVAIIDKVAGAETQRVEFAYDVMDRRIVKKVDVAPLDGVDGVAEHYVYNGDNVLFDFVDADGNGAVAPALAQRYFFGPQVDQVLAQENTTGVVWHLTDHLGTVRDLADNQGQVVNHFVYDSFGNSVTESGTVETRYRYTGRELDEETGLYYYRARYYDSSVGRFIGQDPIGFISGDYNTYRYAKNQPPNLRDPLGLFGQVVSQKREITAHGSHQGSRIRLDTTRIEEVIAAWINNPSIYIKRDVTTAEIRHSNDRSGTPTEGRKRAIDLFPGAASGDVRGHIVGDQLGGSGTDINNLFPFNRKVNNEDWKSYENQVRSLLDNFNRPVFLGNRCWDPEIDLEYKVTLDYSEPETVSWFGPRRYLSGLRPSAVFGKAQFYERDRRIPLLLWAGSVTNPRV